MPLLQRRLTRATSVAPRLMVPRGVVLRVLLGSFFRVLCGTSPVDFVLGGRDMNAVLVALGAGGRWSPCGIFRWPRRRGDTRTRT